MTPTDASSLATYCLQKLGAPVLDIHVAEEQVDNCITEALQFFQEFHGDATERTYLKHRIRGNEITTPAATSFQLGERVTGSVSGATATVTKTEAGILTVGKPIGQFVEGETITGNGSNANGVVGSYTTGDIDNGWIPVGAGVTAITKIFPVTSALSNNLFSTGYQMKVYDLWNLSFNGIGGSLADYSRTRQYLNILDDLLTGEKPFRFNKHTGKVHVDMDWSLVQPGDWIMVQAYVIVDPEEYAAVFNDRMLKQLATAYIKKQWGTNLKLHSNISLIGGITINGQQIYDEAIKEVAEIEDLIRDTYQEPVGFLVG